MSNCSAIDPSRGKSAERVVARRHQFINHSQAIGIEPRDVLFD
jgi:hypothetical protein